MMLRLALAAGVLAAVGVAFVLWRRPARRLRMGTLEGVGVRGPAVAEFVMAGCTPCRSVASILQAVAADARVPFAQIDVDDRPDVARTFGIRSVPTVAVTGPGGWVRDVWTSIPSNGEVSRSARRAGALRR